jgi:hypothetical protein
MYMAVYWSREIANRELICIILPEIYAREIMY